MNNIRDAYLDLSDLSTTAAHGEDHEKREEFFKVNDLNSRDRILASQQKIQSLNDKRSAILVECPDLSVKLEVLGKAKRDSALPKGCARTYLNQDAWENIAVAHSPPGELRMLFWTADMSRFLPRVHGETGDRDWRFFVRSDDKDCIFYVQIKGDEFFRFEQIQKLELQIIKEERRLYYSKQFRRNNRVKALMEDISFRGDKLQEGLLSETPDEQPPEEKEEGTEESVQEPGRKPDAESTSVTTTNESVALSNSAQDGEGEEKSGSVERRNAIVREFLQKKDWGKADLKKHKWKLKPLMKKIDDGAIPLLRGERYENYATYCHLFDDAKKYRCFYGVGAEEVSGNDKPEFNDSYEVYDYLIENLSRGVYPRRKKR